MASAQTGNKSTFKLLALLEAFSPQKPWISISELAEMLELPRVSLYRLVNPLVEKGFLQHDPEAKRYAPGVAFFRLGQTALHTLHFSQALPGVLDEIARLVPHTITVSVLRGRHVVYIDKRESTAGLKVGADVGALLPLHHGGSGKLFLAHMDRDKAAAILETAKNDPDSVLSPAALDALFLQLPAIRKQGHIILPGETIEGLMSVAVPIFAHDGSMDAGISILIPTPLCTENELARCLGILTAACAKLSFI